MSVIVPTRLTSPMDGPICVFKWVGVTENDTCGAVIAPGKSDKTIQVEGTFGGASVRVQGTLDPAGAAYYTLTDPQQTALIFSSAGVKTILENVYSLKPVVVGGSSVAVDVYLLIHG